MLIITVIASQRLFSEYFFMYGDIYLTCKTTYFVKTPIAGIPLKFMITILIESKAPEMR